MRYIDADRFLERLKASPAFPNMGMDGYFLLDVVEELLKKFPTADVVPKSEVANILSDLKKEIHDKAVYPHLSGVEPYINLKVFDAVINKLIGS